MYTREEIDHIIYIPHGNESDDIVIIVDKLRTRILHPDIFDDTIEERDALLKFIILALDVVTHASRTFFPRTFLPRSPSLDKRHYDIKYAVAIDLLYRMAFARGTSVECYDRLAKEMYKSMDEMVNVSY